MSSAFDTKVLDCELYRVGRPPDPWEWVDWLYAGPDGTFSGRWDDRYGRFRVLYASSQRYGAFVETLAQFRPDPHILAAYASMETQEDDATTAPPGDVPLNWCQALAGIPRLSPAVSSG